MKFNNYTIFKIVTKKKSKDIKEIHIIETTFNNVVLQQLDLIIDDGSSFNTFDSAWETIKDLFDDKHDLVTFDGYNYDIPILYYNCIKHKTKCVFSVKNKKVYSLVNSVDGIHPIYGKIDVRPYKFKGPHKNYADIIREMFFKYFHKSVILPGTKNQMLAASNSIIVNNKNEVVLNFGKYKNYPINLIAIHDYSYLKWIANEYCITNKDNDLKLEVVKYLTESDKSYIY